MDETYDIADRIAETAKARSLTVAAAESVTAGSVATALAAAGGASQWFCGSIVAFQTATKGALLGVTAERVISRDCAQQMAEGVLRATGADVVVSVTGVGGPDPEEGRPAGTVLIGAGRKGSLRVFDHAFQGDPEAVVRQATLEALRHLEQAVNA